MSILIFPALRSRKRTIKYYKNGVEYVPWVPGYVTTVQGQEAFGSKEATYLRLYVYGALAVASFVTDVTVDLTNINFLKLDAENVGQDLEYNKSYLVLSSSKMASYNTYDYIWLVSQGLSSRNIFMFNIQNIVGQYYIRLHTTIDEKKGAYGDFRIYEVSVSE